MNNNKLARVARREYYAAIALEASAHAHCDENYFSVVTTTKPDGTVTTELRPDSQQSSMISSSSVKRVALGTDAAVNDAFETDATYAPNGKRMRVASDGEMGSESLGTVPNDASSVRTAPTRTYNPYRALFDRMDTEQPSFV